MSYLKAAVVGAAMTITCQAQAAPVDVDIMFVIDQSGSMTNEFTTLSANVSTFVNGLSGSPDVSSVGVGLVTYEEATKGAGFAGCGQNANEPCLRLWNPISTSADLTPLQTSLDTAAANTFGGTEDALTAVSSVLPGGELFGSALWRDNTVKSVVLITDENADDAGTFSFGALTGYAALGAQLDSVNYLNNIITELGLFGTYANAAKPAGATFDIDAFTFDPTTFLTQFATAKLGEITTGGTPTGGSGGNNPGVVPLPAGLPLAAAGLGIFGLMGWRKKRTA